MKILLSLWFCVVLSVLWVLDYNVTDSAKVPKRTTYALQNIICQFSWQRVVLTDAFYIKNLTHCDHSCKPTSPQDPPRRCFKEENKYCRSRFTLRQLNQVYDALKPGKETEPSEAEGQLEEDDYKVKFVCLSENAVDTVNPCRNDARKTNTGYTSLFVMPSTESTPCKKLCHLVNTHGNKSLQFDINFLTQDGANKDANYLEYFYTDKEGNFFKYNVTSSYQADAKIYMDEVKVRIFVEDLSKITRLWLNLSEPHSSLSCEDDKEMTETEGTHSTVDPAATPYATKEPDHDLEHGDSLIPYIVGGTIGVFVTACVGFFVFCVCKRRSDEENSCQQPTQLSAVPPTGIHDVSLHDDNHVNTQSEQDVTTGDQSYAGIQNETGRGSDDEQYGGLVHDRRREDQAAGDHSEVYDRVTSSQRATSSLTEDGGSQQENDVYGRLNRHPQRQNVVVNVYDSTH